MLEDQASVKGPAQLNLNWDWNKTEGRYNERVLSACEEAESDVEVEE